MNKSSLLSRLVTGILFGTLITLVGSLKTDSLANSDSHVTGVATSAKLKWWYDGRREGWDCVNINAPFDKHPKSDASLWSDNYLCYDSDMPKFVWSTNGPLNNMDCLQIAEVAEPSENKWTVNFLCYPKDSKYIFFWSSAGAINGPTCVQIEEPGDPATWQDNFLCYDLKPRRRPS